MRTLYRRIRRCGIFASHGFFPKIHSLPGVEYLGTEYGGWAVVTSLLNSRSVVLSFGLGQDISFDLELIKRFQLVVHGFDPTPKSEMWVRQQPLPDGFHFHNVGLAGIDGELSFTAPSEPGYVSYSSTSGSIENRQSISLPVKRLATLIDDMGLSQIDILKMDIEGSENEVIEQLVQQKHRPIQLLVEFHHRIHKTPFAKTLAGIKALESVGYDLFQISDLGDEYCFVQRNSLAAANS